MNERQVGTVCVENQNIALAVDDLKDVAVRTMVVVKVLAGNLLTASMGVRMAVGTAVRTAVRTVVRIAVGTVVGMVVKKDARTVHGIVVVVIRRPRYALAVRTVIERAVRIRDGTGSRDIAVGVLLIILLVTPAIRTAPPFIITGTKWPKPGFYPNG